MAVRKPASWMRASDDRILEYLDMVEVDRVKSIDESDDVNYNYETIRRRSKLLANAGLLDEVGNGVYRINGKGRKYLKGLENLRDLDEPV